jgi:hypothetical protein
MTDAYNSIFVSQYVPGVAIYNTPEMAQDRLTEGDGLSVDLIGAMVPIFWSFNLVARVGVLLVRI